MACNVCNELRQQLNNKSPHPPSRRHWADSSRICAGTGSAMGIFKSAKKLVTGEESAKDAFTDCEKLFDEIDEYRRSRH